LIFFGARIISSEAEETRRGKRRCWILGIANNTKGEVVIKVGRGRNGLVKGDIMSKATVAAVREQQ